MVEVEFNMNQDSTVIHARLEELFQAVINKFIQKSSIAPNSVYYIVNGMPVDPQKTVERHMNNLNKQNKKILVLVNSIGPNSQTKEDVMVQSKDIICPQCKEPCRFTVENCKIKLFECINNHTFNNIKFTNFAKTQEINISEIICSICKFKNRGNSVNHEFFFCFTCKQNICTLCKSKHYSNHNIMNYDQKNFICLKHNDVFFKYCEDCHSNICYSCDNEHNHHKTISLLDIKPDIEQLKKKLAVTKRVIDAFTERINDIVHKLNELIKEMNIYYEINKNIINNFDVRNRNYQVLKNLNEINVNNEIYEKLMNTNKYNDIKDKINSIIDLYININYENTKQEKKKNENDINNKENREIIKKDLIEIEDNKSDDEKLNKITIIYDIKNNNRINIFGYEFVKNNLNNCYLIINGKKQDLCQFLDLNNIKIKDNKLEIKLIEISTITNMFAMFSWCKQLKSLPDFSEWDTRNVTDMGNLFRDCYSLNSLPDISKWNTKNVTNMSFMFYNCTSLKSLPDISKWDIHSVTDMRCIFSNCKSLNSFPDISNWEMRKIQFKEAMFDGIDKNIIPKMI